jgi:DNA gyrase subunit A
LEKEIADLQSTLGSHRKLQNVIKQELKTVSDKFGQPRKTEIIYNIDEIQPETEEEEIPDYPVTVFISKEGYLKKITQQSLRMSGEQKLKEGDTMAQTVETTNRAEILVFSDKFQCYKAKLNDFADGKASQLGDYLPQKLGFDAGENVAQVIFPGDYKGFALFFFENGKAAKVPLSAYETKANRRKLTGAYCDKSPLVAAFSMSADAQMAVYTNDGRCVIFSTAQLLPKTTRNTQGVGIVALKKKAIVSSVSPAEISGIVNMSRYRTRTLPSAGAILKDEDAPDKQIQFDV